MAGLARSQRATASAILARAKPVAVIGTSGSVATRRRTCAPG